MICIHLKESFRYTCIVESFSTRILAIEMVRERRDESSPDRDAVLLGDNGEEWRPCHAPPQPRPTRTLQTCSRVNVGWV